MIEALYLPKRVSDDLENIARSVYPNECGGIVDGEIQEQSFFVNNVITGRFQYFTETVQEEPRTPAEFVKKTIVEARDGQKMLEFWLCDIDAQTILEALHGKSTLKSPLEFWIFDIDAEAPLSEEYRWFQRLVKAGEGDYPIHKRKYSEKKTSTFIKAARAKKPYLRWTARNTDNPFDIDPYAIAQNVRDVFDGVPVAGLVITALENDTYKTKAFSLPSLPAVKASYPITVMRLEELKIFFR